MLDADVLADLLPLGDALRDLVPSWDETFLAGLAELERAAASGDAPEVRRLAHSLKGSSACMAASRVARLCDDVQRAAERGVVPVPAAVGRLREEHGAAVAAFLALPRL